ncbi:MAG: zinc metalloprotease HtpX [Microthrixaceae bacterium]|nr:zinc metalloprotease HtpX [Microthrixaceae bacterium]MCB9387605.1 zinc metalloprotease HtpX [Microthrixaceae bacterium]MCO5320765.1 zinc metalloprotease HtpX [Microthrixaceae bacterium]
MLNNLKTAALLAGLGALCMFVGSFWGTNGLIIGLAIGLAMTAGSYWFSDRLAIRSAGAVEVDETQMPQYHAIVAELALRASVPKPKLYVSPQPQPNAFATGRNPEHAAVCVTEGLLRTLNWEEIQGVLAHELSHVRSRDILIGSVAAAIAMGITFVASMARWAFIFGGGQGNGNSRDNPIGGLLMLILAPVAAALIQTAISRSREYEADASAARILGTGEPLARALERLEDGAARIPSPVNPAEASNYIVNPLRGRQMTQWFSTHPPVQERITRLRSGAWV